MDFPAVLVRLNDLPNTFKRSGPPYTQVIDGVARELALFTVGADATMSQVLTFGVALDGWLDVWGLLWGVPRAPNEANVIYSTRISRTVLAWVGTVPAIQQWLNFYAAGGTITENLPNVGYVITLPASMTSAQIRAFLLSLNRIRPAGVPFTVFQAGGGLYLGTTEFLNDGNVMGSYLSVGTSPVVLPQGPSTPNSVPLLPDLFFNDATLNPAT